MSSEEEHIGIKYKETMCFQDKNSIVIQVVSMCFSLMSIVNTKKLYVIN
jgi:hypothetical protein